jgi:GR25 family glycosyltransferase involved in LPS biosynthesis
MRLEEYFDKIFVINLARRQDRREGVDFILRGNDVNDYCLFAGYDNAIEHHAGCTRSHRMLIKDIANSDWERVLILEDDIDFISLDVLKGGGYIPEQANWKTWCSVPKSTLQERFSYMLGFVPQGWDVLYLGGGYAGPPIKRINKHVIRCGRMMTTSSYGITREFAKVFTEKVDKALPDIDSLGPIDCIFSGLAHEHNFYIFQPRLFYQRESPSDITGQTHSYLQSMTDCVGEESV